MVTAWNGQGISAFALASQVLAGEQLGPGCHFPVDGCPSTTYLEAAKRVASFVKQHLWNQEAKRLLRSYCNGPGSVEGKDSRALQG